MSYKEMFDNDPKYTEIVSTFQRKKAKMELMASQGLYRKEHLQEVAKKIHEELQQSIQEYTRSKVDSLQEAKKALENRNKRVGYADRPDDVRELEMRFKLANKSQLEDMVTDLNTDDLLEVNLLRSELKNRQLDDLDKKVERYSMTNLEGLQGLDEESKKQYESINHEIGVFSTMGSRYLVAKDGLLPVEQVGNDLLKTANTVVNDKSVVRDVDITAF